MRPSSTHFLRVRGTRDVPSTAPLEELEDVGRTTPTWVGETLSLTPLSARAGRFLSRGTFKVEIVGGIWAPSNPWDVLHGFRIRHVDMVSKISPRT